MVWLVPQSRLHERSAFLVALLELKTRVESVRWLDDHYTGREEMIGKAICLRGAYILGELCMFENNSSPQSGPCLLHKGGGGGTYFWEDMVHYILECMVIPYQSTKFIFINKN